MPLVATRIDDTVGTITMQNSRKHNALSGEMVEGMISAVEDFCRRRIRVVILRAQDGAKVWSAGHDVRELPVGHRDPLGWDDPLRKLIRVIETCPAPVIAMIEGTVWGGATEVVFACDLVVAESNASFAVTPAKLGVPYNITGVLNFLNATSRVIVREMAFTGEPVSAARAESLGMVNYVVDKPRLESFTVELARKITRNAPLSVAVIKEQMRIMESAHSITPRMFERIQGLRRAVYDSHDYEEGLKAFLEKRCPNFKGE